MQSEAWVLCVLSDTWTFVLFSQNHKDFIAMTVRVIKLKLNNYYYHHQIEGWEDKYSAHALKTPFPLPLRTCLLFTQMPMIWGRMENCAQGTLVCWSEYFLCGKSLWPENKVIPWFISIQTKLCMNSHTPHIALNILHRIAHGFLHTDRFMCKSYQLHACPKHILSRKYS